MIFDHVMGNNVLTNQLMTTGLRDLDVSEFFTFLIKAYVKKDWNMDDGNLRIKIENVDKIFWIAKEKFYVTGKVVDS